MNMDTMRLFGLLAIAGALVAWFPLRLATPPHNASGSIVGYPRVIDGDTIDIAGRRIRLDGIDAPEAAQTCLADAQSYRCGIQATLALADLIKGQFVRCEPSGTDRYRRTLARCRTEGDNVDINAWLVRQGLAVAYRQYSYRYLPEELLARVAGRGLWAGSFQMPWDYRADNRHGRGDTYW